MSRTPAYSVTDATATLRAGPPRELIVAAQGLVNTSGWRAPALDPRMTIPELKPPADGILDLHLTAEPPASGVVVLQLMTNVHGSIVIPNPPAWIMGVRIRAATNKLSISV